MHFEFALFAGQPLRHAMSTRRPELPAAGDVGYSPDSAPEHIAANRACFLQGAGIEPDGLTLGRQVHGDRVALVTVAERGRGQPPAFDAIPATDGLVTASSHVALGVIVADCVPLLLYDPSQHALGVVHAGWRGTVAGIAAEAVAQMTDAFGSRPPDLLAGIGPSIGPCCYEVGDEVIDAWSADGPPGWATARIPLQPRPHFDLWQANRLTLLQAGLNEERIETAGICTRCHCERYFSHRAAVAGESPRGRMIMAAQLT